MMGVSEERTDLMPPQEQGVFASYQTLSCLNLPSTYYVRVDLPHTGQTSNHSAGSAQMASAASAVTTQTPCIVFDSRKAGLISIVEEELPTEVSPSESPLPLAPTWRKVDYFSDSKTEDVKGHGVKSVSGPGCPVFKHSFSFGQGSKTRKESGASPDPMSLESGIQRPSSARKGLTAGEWITDTVNRIKAQSFCEKLISTVIQGFSANTTRAQSTHSGLFFTFDVDIESVRDDNQHNHDSFDGAQTQRTPSLLVPLFGHFQWNNTDSAVVLPSQELEPAYQEALAGVAEDPDFVEVEIEPKAGSISRRASLFANIFTNKDVDVDPDLKFEPSASEVEIKQGIAEAQKERSRRKMVYSRNIAATSLVMINTVCIVLSFGLFSVWYATAPLVLLAPLVRSTMVVDLIVSHAYKKLRLLLDPPEEELEVPTMDYAIAVSFSNESFEDIQSTLDSLVDQKDVDMHKNLMLISCNDNVWNSESAKSTTRIILENILTNIVDEAKFQMPRDGPDAGFDNMWCRRGIYKGLPYILMIKEGMTNKVEFVDLIRNLLHSYNLRKESYHNSVPSAFFAWYEEWAELHDFASFDFLVNVNSETLLDEHCISQLYQQALKNPACAGVSSRVEIDSRSSRWGVENLFTNSQLLYDQIRQSHQTQIMHKASVSPSACQMLRICEETCGPQVLEEIKKRRPSPMSNMVKQICSSTEEDDMLYESPEVVTLQAVHAVTYARSSTTLSDFSIQRQRIAFFTCATNLAILCNNQIHWFERLSSAADLLAWYLPICSLAIIINFLRSAVLGQNIPVLIVLSAIVALPWVYGIASAMWLARSWEGRLRHLLGFCILVLTGPIVAIVVVVSTVFNLHLLRPEQPKRRRSSAIAAQIQPSAV
ncbi:hypothetical protein E4T50_03063 [Aureobasidium sp. EXF-12298]|nr:hypothetical protein E4T50_03063 [Aureobasidium sp. EXF-12298]KAI4766691.1 hypothetical protein E4T51_00359 [Aureobasidium sp. EXF-12344]